MIKKIFKLVNEFSFGETNNDLIEVTILKSTNTKLINRLKKYSYQLSYNSKLNQLEIKLKDKLLKVLKDIDIHIRLKKVEAYGKLMLTELDFIKTNFLISDIIKNKGLQATTYSSLSYGVYQIGIKKIVSWNNSVVKKRISEQKLGNNTYAESMKLLKDVGEKFINSQKTC